MSASPFPEPEYVCADCGGSGGEFESFCTTCFGTGVEPPGEAGDEEEDDP